MGGKRGFYGAALESGVSLGLILPSQKEYDQLVATMARRTFLPALVFLGLLSLLGLRGKRPLLVFETYLAAAAFGFFFVLVAYLGAFMHFYVAYAVSALGLGAAVVAYLKRLFPDESARLLTAMVLVTRPAVRAFLTERPT